MGDDLGRLYRLDGVAHIAGVINDEPQRCISSMRRQQGMRLDERQIQKFTVNCSWFQETFEECPEGADEETVRRFARAYIMMLLGTQLFTDKSGNRIHIRWLPYVARLEEMGGYSWGSAALAWLYRCMCRVANRHIVKLAGPLQLLQSWIFWRFSRFRPDGFDLFSWPLASSTPEVVQVVHPEVLESRHTALWRSVTSLIYFAVVEWHQVDRVLPQFGGVQARPRPALNIDFLMLKDGRGGDRWFSSQLQH
nr:protein MAIN-LIKE 1-like [Arachis hypogaea]